MRKLMNKKGFSLVELMIVVVIMGILIAVAIPIYGAITKSANNKTCASNGQTLRNAVQNYYTATDPNSAPTLSEVKGMMENDKMPVCPVSKTTTYSVGINNKGAAAVACENVGDDHTPDNVTETLPTGYTALENGDTAPENGDTAPENG